MKEQKNSESEEFQPKGTMVVLLIFVLTLILLWGSVYWILISRGVTVTG
jgi:hypothetical protein